jgi:hypothetical protein
MTADAPPPNFGVVEPGVEEAGAGDHHRSRARRRALDDFQVAVKLDGPGLRGGRGEERRGRPALRGGDGRLLEHEIELWNPAGGSLVWLRCRSWRRARRPCSCTTATPTRPFPSPRRWSGPSPTRACGTSAGSGKDATPHGFDGAMMAGGAFTDGRLGKGLTLDGSKHEHITLKPDIKLVAGAPGCTFSAWINPTKIEDSVNGMIIMTVGKWFNNNHNSYTDFNINASGQMISHVDPGANTAASGYARILSDPGFVKTNEWAWVTYVIDLPAKQERFFKNGQLVSTKPPPAGKAWADAFIDMVSTRVVIGSEEDVVSHHYTGSMDELRLEKGMRSPAWIAAQYRSMTAAGYVKVEADQ